MILPWLHRLGYTGQTGTYLPGTSTKRGDHCAEQAAGAINTRWESAGKLQNALAHSYREKAHRAEDRRTRLESLSLDLRSLVCPDPVYVHVQAHLHTARLFLSCWMASQFFCVSLCYRGERAIAETATSSRKPTESTHKLCCARSSCWRRRRGRWVTCCRFKCQDCSRRTRAWHNSKRRLSLVCGPWRLHHSESMSMPVCGRLHRDI